jgi:ATP/maltotriose-dependent transcriptional regulator MalT
MLLDAERFDVVEPALDQAVDDARRRGSVLGFAIASTQRSGAAYLRGAIGEAEMEIRGALDAVHEAGWELGLPMTLSGLVDVLIERGRFEEASDVLDAAGMSGELPELLGFDWLLYSRGRLRLATGDRERGLVDLVEVGARQARAGLPPVRHNWRAVTAPVLAVQGERRRAVAMAEEELEFSRGVAASRNQGMALRALGIAEGGEHGIDHLRESAALLETSPARLEQARTLVELGAALRRAGKRSEARAWLERGRALAVQCGGDVLAQRATDELTVLGVRTARKPSSGLGALTASELRVARMAASGMTNPEIAQSLFVTRKTIEKHLGNAYAKLGIATRQELPDTLGRTG